jgi:hypothetical protein
MSLIVSCRVVWQREICGLTWVYTRLLRLLAPRAVLGSPSLSVMQQCNAPVTLVAERKEGSFN